MFNVTPTAVTQLLEASARSNAEGMALRIAARPLEDGSIEYGMGFDDERENDESAEFSGLTVLLGAKSRPYLAGTLLDYVEVEPGQFGFVFIASDEPAPPPATGACGSGGCNRCGG